MAKPAGGSCNLDCSYCFYTKKTALYPGSRRMTPEVQERYVRDVIAATPGPEVTFSWQGGEPTLMGLAFFERAIKLQRQFGKGRRITNALQTNGTLLDDGWGRLLARNRFLVGISIDGPAKVHDAQRCDRRGLGSLDDVLRGVEVLKRHHVEFNVLTVVSALNAQYPEVVYRFLRKIGARHLQFIPLVERAVADADDLEAVPGEVRLTPASVSAEAYGDFLCRVFDEWLKRDVGKIFVRDFEDMLNLWMGNPSSSCVRSETCGRAVALEHNGDVYSCDHYVYREHRLGNLLEDDWASMIDGAQQRKFGQDKRTTLPTQCRECRWVFACQGGCPKHRLETTATGEPGLNHLCAGWKKFCEHADPTLRWMVNELRAGRPLVGRR
jgi:uncharacterized protein